MVGCPHHTLHSVSFRHFDHYHSVAKVPKYMGNISCMFLVAYIQVSLRIRCHI